jgi:signal transduction histidine kinase/ActR/RegA family two-component response regulator
MSPDSKELQEVFPKNSFSFIAFFCCCLFASSLYFIFYTYETIDELLNSDFPALESNAINIRYLNENNLLIKSYLSNPSTKKKSQIESNIEILEYNISEINTILSKNTRLTKYKLNQQNFARLLKYQTKVIRLVDSGQTDQGSELYTSPSYLSLSDQVNKNVSSIATILSTRRDESLKKQQSGIMTVFILVLVAVIFITAFTFKIYRLFQYNLLTAIALKKENDQISLLSSSVQSMAKIGGWKLLIGDTKMTWTNETYSIFGLDPDTEVTLEQFILFFNHEEQANIISLLSPSNSNKKNWDIELTINISNSEKKWVRFTGSTDQSNLFTGTIQDITKRKSAELEFENEKEKSFHSAKLSTIGELAAGVGHEINNPMTIIKGNLFLLKRKFQKNKVAPSLYESTFEIFDSAIDRVINITNGLRIFSRKDNNSTQIFSFNSIVEESYKLLKDIYANENVKINCNLPDNDLMIYGNKGRMGQVLMNLFGNAKDAISERRKIQKVEGQLDVSLQQEDRYLLFKVTDNGQGIPDKIKTKIFDTFFTTKEIGKGTGIGLSLIQTIITEHQGTIDLQSEVGKGTTFSIKIPLAQENVNTKDSLQIEKNEKTDLSISLLGIHVLLVDDEYEVANPLAQFLITHQAEVSFVSDGKQAIDALFDETKKFDCIITDIKMPVMNGHELLKNLTQHQRFNTLYKIAVTGGVNIDISELESVCDKVISKPYNFNQILTTIHHFNNNPSKKSA